MLRKLGILAVVLTASYLTGCGGGNKVAVNYVEGTVTMDGAPLANATVSFSPVAGGPGKAAVGVTDASGVYKLTDMQNTVVGSGAVTGEYQVAISKPVAAPAYDPEAWKTDPNYGKDIPGSHVKAVEVKSEVPTGYTTTMTSGLTASVKPGKNTGINFELKKDFKPKK